jgi:hypothetical protein
MRIHLTTDRGIHGYQKWGAIRMRFDIRMMKRIWGMELDPNDPTVNAASTLQLDQYSAKKAKDRLIDASRSQWLGYFE